MTRAVRSSVPGRRERRTLVAVAGPVLALALALPAHAGDERILGKDDLPFVRALVRNGYPDLAEELLGTIETTRKGSADDALWAQALRLELQEAAAYADPDPVQQGQKLQATVDAMEVFVKAHPGTGATEALTDRLLELYRGFGERVAALLKDEATASQAEGLRGTGDKMFTRAIDTLKADREALAEKLAKQDPADPDLDLERRAMLAAYNLARTYYFAAQLQQDEYLRDTRLKSAISVLGDIQLEYPDQLLCYEGYIYEGLSHRDMGKPDEALVSFDYAIGLRDTYERSDNGFFLMPPEAADIVSSAVLQKMLVLAGKGDHAGVVALSRDFYATIPEAASTLRGLAILGREAESCREMGDQKGLQAAAQKLVDLDPRGPGGERGRELLGTSTSSLGAADTFVLAQAAARRSDTPRAITLCQETLRQARGGAGVGDLGSQASLLLGALLAQRNWLHEAVVVWSAVTERYADGKDAPECLWRAANGYLALQSQEPSAFYRDGAREVMSRLSQRYPQHQYASMAAIIEGQQLEAEQKFTEAVQVYERIPVGGAGHEEALYRSGNALSRLARQQLQEGKSAEGAASAKRSEELLKKAQTALNAAAGKTLDLGAQDRLRGLAFNARVALANLYLTKGVDRGAEVLKLFESPEREFASDATKLSAAQALRLKALQATGKVDEAVAMLDAALKADPSGKSVAANASFLARALDERGVEQKATSSVDADASWRKAASLYVLAVRGQIEGREAVRVDELEPIANRLFALGLHFNGVPEDVDSFTEWTGTRLDEELLSVAARAYETLLPQTPSYRTRMNLARTQGFLRRWDEAASGYAQLFDREPFANTVTRSIDNEAMREKPELLSAFLEWGVCEREVGLAQKAPDRLSRASAIFETLVLGTRTESRSWWLGKYYQLQTLVERGEYTMADIGLRDIQIKYPEYDAGQYGLKDRFERLSDELKRKVFK